MNPSVGFRSRATQESRQVSIKPQRSQSKMKILGISAHYHDSAAALLIDGVPVRAVQEERLSRRKNDAGFPMAAIEWCLDHAGLDPADLDAVVFYERSMLKFERILTCSLRAFPRSWRSFPNAIKNSLGEKVWVRGIISSHLDVPRTQNSVYWTPPRARRRSVSHRADAARRHPDRRRCGRVGDPDGRPGRAARGRRTEIKLLREIRFPHSLGMLYSTFTAYLGFAVNEDEYKVMGLAAYGRPTMIDKVRKLIRRTPDGAFALDLDYFEYPDDGVALVFVAVRRVVRPAAQYLRTDRPGYRGRPAFCRLRRQRSTGSRRHAGGHGPRAPSRDGPAGSLSRRRRRAERRGQRAHPCRIGIRAGLRSAGSRRCWLCTRRGTLRRPYLFRQPDRDVPDHPFWGPQVDADDLARAAARGWPDRRTELDEPALIERVADELAAGRVVGWMDGASEFGPRALGHRSILAAPHSKEMRDRLNRDIKYREEFRPFAPVAPDRGGRRFFELPAGGARLARFMSGVFPGAAGVARRRWRRSRTSTERRGCRRSSANMAPRLYALLEAYGRRSGVPVLLNTSFNVAGEPIVNRAVEGYSTFRRCGIDVLVAGSTLVTKRAVSAASRKRRWRDQEARQFPAPA